MDDGSQVDKPRDEIKQTQPPQPTATKEDGNKPPIKPVIPAPPNPQPPVSNPSNPSNRHKNRCGWKCCKEWLEAIGIIAGVAVLIVLCLQYREMAKTTQAMINQIGVMQGQFQAMTNQDYILQGQLDEAKRDSRLDERAWVTASRPTFHLDPDTGIVGITVYFDNTGKTPALLCRTYVGLANSTNEILTNDPDPSPAGGYLLAPNAVSYGYTEFYEHATRREVGREVKQFYIFGTARYQDISKKPHWSQFCYQASYGWISTNDMAFMTPQELSIHSSCDDATNQDYQ